MKKFKEFEVQNLENVIGGINIKITVSGLFDGVKGNGDIHIDQLPYLITPINN
jgi:hypothetical protein